VAKKSSDDSAHDSVDFSDSDLECPMTSKVKPEEAVDPNAPKKPYNAYVYFCIHNHPDVQQQNPGKTFGEISKEMGRRYQQLSPEEKLHWQNVVTSKNQRYVRKQEAYNANKTAANYHL